MQESHVSGASAPESSNHRRSTRGAGDCSAWPFCSSMAPAGGKGGLGGKGKGGGCPPPLIPPLNMHAQFWGPPRCDPMARQQQPKSPDRAMAISRPPAAGGAASRPASRRAAGAARQRFAHGLPDGWGAQHTWEPSRGAVTPYWPAAAASISLSCCFCGGRRRQRRSCQGRLRPAPPVLPI